MVLKVPLCGDGAVGKTALRLRYMGKGFQSRYMMTIGADFAIKDVQVSRGKFAGEIHKVQIWDLAGQVSFSVVRPLYYAGSHGALLAFDCTRPSSLDNIPNWVAEILRGVGKKIPIVLIANKIDLRRQTEVAISAEEGREMARQISDEYFEGRLKVPYYETSAKSGENVEEAFEKIVELGLS